MATDLRLRGAEVLASASTAAFLGSADIVSDELLQQQDTPARLQVAAMFHDARARLGWEAPRVAT